MDNAFLGYSIFEDWDIREKIAKFIINSSQVFIFFNFQVRFFFWDDGLMDFFRRLPPAFKKNKNLYNRCLKEKFFSPFGLNFDHELAPSAFELRLQRFKDFIKPVLPRAIQLRYMHKNDWACYEKLSDFMVKDIGEGTRKRLPYRDFNSILINWYLEQIGKRH
jgi:asparagine synthase (glutamine-hydrolysing)